MQVESVDDVKEDFNDKFAIYYLDFTNYNENKDSIEKFISQNKDK